MRERAPAASSVSPASDVATDGALPTRNRRTALALVAWILVLMLASALVAWLRN